MRRWLRPVHAVVWRVERVLDGLRRWVASWTGTDRPRSVLAFTGWSNGVTLRCGGRVLASPPARGPNSGDTAWRNLQSSWYAWNSREVRGAAVRLTVGAMNDETVVTAEAVSDEEGYVFFDLALDVPLGRGAAGDGRHATRLEVLGWPGRSGDAGPTGVAGAAVVVEPPPDADLGLISDVDDTVLHTGITSLWTTLRLTFLGNARTRQALPGVATLYRWFAAGGNPDAHPRVAQAASSRRPVFYVSSSPWNLHGLLTGFFALNRLPAGPVLLQDYGVDATKFITGFGHTHKLDQARKIVDDFPRVRFVLCGDSGQRDPVLYRRLVEERPGRVAAVLIRDVDPLRPGRRDGAAEAELQRVRDRGVPAFLAQSSAAMAGHLVRAGLLPSDAVAAVQAAAARDRDRPAVARAAVAAAVGLDGTPSAHPSTDPLTDPATGPSTDPSTDPATGL